MQAVGLQTYIWNNNIRSGLLLAGFPLLLVGMVFVITLGMIWGGLLPSSGSPAGDLAYAGGLLVASAPAAIIVALIWFAIAYVFNQAIIDMATGSRPVQRADEPELYNLLENLCISRGMKTPTPRVIETDGMNAFASGLREGRFSVTVTRGLLSGLSRDELEAVLAHELTHVINRDVRTMVIASIFAGIITLICQIIYRSIWWTGGGRGRGRGAWVFWLVAMAAAAIGYVLAIVIRMAISRAREFVADAGSVELTKNPDAMISALQKVAGHTHLDAPQSMRAMFLEEEDDGIFGLFATHPPVAKRIAALQHYAGGRIVEIPDPAVSPAAPAQIVGDAPERTITMTAAAAPVVSVTRRFNASPERVFDAWLDPKLAGRWLFATPAGAMVRVVIDPRVGGEFTIVERRDGEDVEHTGRYLQIDRPRRLVFTFAVPKYSAEITRVYIEITTAGSGCVLVLTHEGVLPDYLDRTPDGWKMILEGLSKAVEEEAPSS